MRTKPTPTCSPLLPLSPDSSLKVLLRASPAPPPLFLFLGSRALALRRKSPPESRELSLSTLQLNHLLDLFLRGEKEIPVHYAWIRGDTLKPGEDGWSGVGIGTTV